jgi:hypothetical protein
MNLQVSLGHSQCPDSERELVVWRDQVSLSPGMRSPSGLCWLTGIIDHAGLVEDTFHVFLQPASVLCRNLLSDITPHQQTQDTHRLLPAHDQVARATDHLLVGIMCVHQSHRGPGRLNDLRHFVPAVLFGDTRLRYIDQVSVTPSP